MYIQKATYEAFLTTAMKTNKIFCPNIPKLQSRSFIKWTFKENSAQRTAKK